jgi:diaminohydroxyphosphoribosylaminopyrimidine deaminase / 5-amino-6-(5-phosphoribosylamino)uracil reductase
MSTKKDKFSFKDKLYMGLALDLAKAREGLTGTNPSVGCVIVKDDIIISIGQTSINGRPHAEFNAIKNCNESLKGSKMYVTLEPCSHYGVTPPCTNLIIRSNITEVIYSIIDIDKKVSGKSKKILSSKKIKVKTGLLNNEIKEFYKSYFFNRKNHLPYVTGKIAISKNNLIYSKDNKRITNTLSDKFTHYLRYKNDSILISYKTLNKDNPKLNCRLKNLKRFSPKRIILDNKLELNKKSHLFKTANKKNTIVFYNEADKAKIIDFKKSKIELIKSKIDKNKKFDIIVILKKLYNLGFRNTLIEGGNDLTNYLLKKKLFNQFYLFKGSKKLSKSIEFKEFTGLKILKKTYKNKLKLKSNFGKDKVTLHRNLNV